MIENELFVEFIECLNNNNVKYVLIGGFAVIAHGFVRNTEDIDFFIENKKENIEKVLKTISEFYAIPILEGSVDEFYKPKKMIQLGNKPNRIDLIKAADGIEFHEVYPARISAKVKNITVEIIDIENLIKNKKASGRDKDLMDASELEKIKKHSGK